MAWPIKPKLKVNEAAPQQKLARVKVSGNSDSPAGEPWSQQPSPYTAAAHLRAAAGKKQ